MTEKQADGPGDRFIYKDPSGRSIGQGDKLNIEGDRVLVSVPPEKLVELRLADNIPHLTGLSLGSLGAVQDNKHHLYVVGRTGELFEFTLAETLPGETVVQGRQPQADLADLLSEASDVLGSVAPEGLASSRSIEAIPKRGVGGGVWRTPCAGRVMMSAGDYTYMIYGGNDPRFPSYALHELCITGVNKKDHNLDEPPLYFDFGQQVSVGRTQDNTFPSQNQALPDHAFLLTLHKSEAWGGLANILELKVPGDLPEDARLYVNAPIPQPEHFNPQISDINLQIIRAWRDRVMAARREGARISLFWEYAVDENGSIRNPEADVSAVPPGDGDLVFRFQIRGNGRITLTEAYHRAIGFRIKDPHCREAVTAYKILPQNMKTPIETLNKMQ